MAVEPNNPLDSLFLLFTLFLFGFFGFFGITTSSEPPGAIPPPVESTIPAQAADGNESLTIIDSVETIVMESYPYQITLHVTGYQPDGCTFPVQVEQSRQDNTVTVKIYRIVPTDVMCTMQLVPYDANIPLDGGFESGSWTIDVNGTVVNLDL
jgi:hypothetical protein